MLSFQSSPPPQGLQTQVVPCPLGSHAAGTQLLLVPRAQSLPVQRKGLGIARASGGPKATDIGCRRTRGSPSAAGNLLHAPTCAGAAAVGRGQTEQGGDRPLCQCSAVAQVTNTGSGLHVND